MTCFWDAIIQSMSAEDLKILGFQRRPYAADFAKRLIKRNVKAENVEWCGEKLRELDLDHAFEGVRDLDIKYINQGYLCGSCDHFLLLVCELLKCRIEYLVYDAMYTGTKTNIVYEYVGDGRRSSLLRFTNNRGHFSKI